MTVAKVLTRAPDAVQGKPNLGGGTLSPKAVKEFPSNSKPKTTFVRPLL
ncbi:MAG: hypothetical protein K2I30_03850 [Clostridia bacterium]|nr:hypothetical protein [Clostridia bacterium]MDE5721856.1 hypothetical protein [Clostridia bacterium]